MIIEYRKQIDVRPLRPVRWGSGGLVLLDQRRLPAEEIYLHFSTSAEVAQGIRDMVVRGAPAIGLAAAYGAALAAIESGAVGGHPEQWLRRFKQSLQPLLMSRPTAVNLAWALRRMELAAEELLVAGDQDLAALLLQLANNMVAEDLEQGGRMAQLGAALIEPGSRVLTHCNAGALATAGVGTALGVINAAWARGCVDQVYTSETRPWFQGSRLTAWELQQQGIDPCVVVEGAVGALLRDHSVNWLIVGADRIAANGDLVNKIGTYGAAVLARQHGTKVMVVAPTSSFDLRMANGTQIDIEQRGSEEVTDFAGARVAAEDVSVWNPVFDMTPAQWVDLIVTEKGVVEAPSLATVGALIGGLER